MRKVLLTIGCLTTGGAEVRLLQFFQAVRSRQVKVAATIYVVSGLPGSLDEKFKAAGVRVVYGKPGLAGLMKLYRVCRSEGFDIFHANSSLAGGFCCLAALLAGVPTRISHIRSTGYDRRGRFMSLRNSIYRIFLNRFSTKVIGVCSAAQEFAGTESSRWQTVYDGVAPARVELLKGPREYRGGLRVLMLGRIDTPKNPLRAIAIADAIRRRAPGGFRFSMVGRFAGDFEELVRSEIERRGLHEIVNLPGPTTDPIGRLMESDVLLLTSTREGLPGVVLEALSCGIPVVASSLPGVKEIASATKGVSVLDLALDDEIWADALIRAPKIARAGSIAEAFKASPFTFERHFQEMMELWRI